MPTTRKPCPTCGAALEGDGDGPACPSCLFQLAADVGTADRSCATAFTPPEPSELASLMPDFELQSLLGTGGMGAVYRVHQKRLNRPAALKVLPPERAADPAFLERFFREAQALAQLSHPNVVSVYDMGQRGPYLYILMEHVDGSTLRDRIRTGALEPRTAMRIVADLCAAVDCAHQQGIVHRDIKPENVLIATDGRVKLVDFGLVRLACQSGVDPFTLTEVNLRMGTPSYMAPEQTSGSADMDHRVDVYALGVLLYEILTGELPVLDYTPPSRKVTVDPRIDRAVHRAIRASPDERYQSAAELGQDIEHIVRTPRRRIALATSVLLLLVAIGLGGWLSYEVATADPAPPPGMPVDGVPIAVAPFGAEAAREHQQRWADHLGVPVEWTNSIGMDFVLIPPGEYTRGIPEDRLPEDFTDPSADVEATREAVIRSCIPAHRVRLTRAYYLGRTEVTQGQYRQVTGEPVGYFRYGMPGEIRIDGIDTDTLPAENLAWHMAGNFCEQLSMLEGFRDPNAAYRLPTDAEWAFAIRAGTTTRFWYGAEMDVDGVYEMSGDSGPDHPIPVASKRPNPFGLYDMAGNVREYVSDWWTPDAFQRYADRCALDPTGPDDGLSGGLQRVVRGGHFGVRAYDHDSTNRARHEPTLWVNTLGFRVALPARAVAEKLSGTPSDTPEPTP